MATADTDKENRWQRVQKFLGGFVTEAITMRKGASDGRLLASDAEGRATWTADSGITTYAGEVVCYGGDVVFS